MNKTYTWIFVCVGIFIAGGLVSLVATQSSTESGATTQSIVSVTEQDQIKGNLLSQIVLIEYADFQCPACGAYYPILKQLSDAFGDRATFVYRHFPLSQHQHAEIMARAGEAAGAQGKFWEMHNMIFENQNVWSRASNVRSTITEYVTALGLDQNRFSQDLDASEIKEKVKSDYQGGLQAGVNSTPTFFLNGVKLQNPRSYQEFETLFNDTISKTQ